MKLSFPPISRILLKLCLFAHILLVSLAYLGFAPGVGSFFQKLYFFHFWKYVVDHFCFVQGFYLYLNLIFFGLLFLSLFVPTHPETVHLALATNLVSISHDANVMTMIINIMVKITIMNIIR